MSEFSAPAPLTQDHDLSRFECGKPSLDEFLVHHALGRQNAMLSRTYVVTAPGSNRVLAYYTLAHITITRETAPKKMARGMPDGIPALLLARLAVDLRHQGERLGSSLFSDALRRTWNVMAGSAAPVRFFVVDALDLEAKAFYERKGMLPSPTNPMRLFLHYKDLQALYS